MATKALEEELQASLGIADPVKRFRRLDRLKTNTIKFSEAIANAKADTVREMRARNPQPTWEEIGAELGLSPQRVHKMAN